MTLREFTTPEGERWRVWEVRPSILATDQVVNRERRVSAAPEPVVERRTARPAVRPEFERGWLAFESSSLNRRLTPIPTGWDTCSEAELRSYWERARSEET